MCFGPSEGGSDPSLWMIRFVPDAMLRLTLLLTPILHQKIRKLLEMNTVSRTLLLLEETGLEEKMEDQQGQESHPKVATSKDSLEPARKEQVPPPPPPQNTGRQVHFTCRHGLRELF